MEHPFLTLWEKPSRLVVGPAAADLQSNGPFSTQPVQYPHPLRFAQHLPPREGSGAQKMREALKSPAF